MKKRWRLCPWRIIRPLSPMSSTFTPSRKISPSPPLANLIVQHDRRSATTVFPFRHLVRFDCSPSQNPMTGSLHKKRLRPSRRSLQIQFSETDTVSTTDYCERRRPIIPTNPAKASMTIEEGSGTAAIANRLKNNS